MDIHILVFGPTPLVDTLVTLSDSSKLVIRVGVESTASDPEVYDVLLLALVELIGEELDESPEPIMILCPEMGDRYSTIALSIPKKELYVMTGMNVSMLSALRYYPPFQESNKEKATDYPSLNSDDEVTNEELTKNGILLGHRPTSIASSSLPRNQIEVLSELLSRAGKDGVYALHYFLRDEGEDSNIDASILETDFSSLN